MTLGDLSFYVAMAGTVAFASSAVLSVAERKVDLFAAIVLGTITAVGGGTVRDIILNVPVFWAKELIYIWVSIAASVPRSLPTGSLSGDSSTRCSCTWTGLPWPCSAYKPRTRSGVWASDYPLRR